MKYLRRETLKDKRYHSQSKTLVENDSNWVFEGFKVQILSLCDVTIRARLRVCIREIANISASARHTIYGVIGYNLVRSRLQKVDSVVQVGLCFFFFYDCQRYYEITIIASSTAM